MRIAMWSGPRNLSTALMYSFAARGDCGVWDEPFYAPFLAATGIEHPMGDQVIAAHETDPKRVAKACLETVQGDLPHFYMKHMPHHMLPDFPLDWAADCVNVHLIRHPARVIASYAAKREHPTMLDIGFERQVELYRQIGGVIVDGSDIRQSPARALSVLCAEIGLPYTDAMLRWSRGGCAQDGVWAKHWYGAVHQSTGFAGPEGPLPQLDGAYQALCDKALPFFNELHRRKLATG